MNAYLFDLDLNGIHTTQLVNAPTRIIALEIVSEDNQGARINLLNIF